MRKTYLQHRRQRKICVLKKVHRVIKFNQRAQLKPYIDMNTKKRKEAKNEFEKNFFKLMINSLLITDEKRNKLVSEPNYHTTKQSSENLLATEMKKNKSKSE